jgi:geranylgeranyl diphosphate synthase, type I
MTLDTFKQWLDPHITTEFDRIDARVQASTKDVFVLNSCAHIRNIFATKGKRTRAYLCFLGYSAAQKEDKERCINLFIAIELFHAFALIHDDIIDEAATRHNTPTVHKVIKETLSGDEAHTTHISNGQAMLVGDLILAHAFECLFRFLQTQTGNTTAIWNDFQSMVTEVVAGEMIDVDLMVRDSATEERLYEKLYLKTASYSAIRPLRMGALAGGDTTLADTFCVSFGTGLGLGYQYQDDLLDIIGANTTLEKPTLMQVQNKERTHITEYAFAHEARTGETTLSTLWGKALTPDQANEVREYLIATGATADTQARMERAYTDAYNVLNTSTLSAEAKQLYTELLERIIVRIQ